MRWEPDWRLTVQPLRSRAARTRRAFVGGQCSRRPERYVDEFGRRFPLLEALGNHAEGKRLHSRDGWLQLAIGNESSIAGGAPRSFIPRSISERASSLGGTSFVENSEDGHIIVHVSIPT